MTIDWLYDWPYGSANWSLLTMTTSLLSLTIYNLFTIIDSWQILCQTPVDQEWHCATSVSSPTIGRTDKDKW